MDYTKLPQELIYQNKGSLEDFIRANALTETLVENMEDIDILTNGEFESTALDCMNLTYYICTLIMLEKRPEWRWGYFLDCASNFYCHQQGEFLDIIITLTYILLDHTNSQWKQKHIKIMNKFIEFERPLFFVDKTISARNVLTGTYDPKNIWGILNRGITESMTLPDDEFAPCKIDDGTISKISQYGWTQYTNNYEENKVFEFLNSIGKNNTEKLYLVEFIIEKATDYFGEKIIFLPIYDRLSEYKKSVNEALLFSFSADNSSKSSHNELEELKEKEPQMPQLAQQPAFTETQEIGELQAQLAAALTRIKELEAENQQLSDAPSAQPVIEKLEQEVKRLEQEKEETIVELLKPIFYCSEEDVREFLKKIDGRPDTEIIEVTCEWVKERKISDKSKNRPLWNVLHAFKYYKATESNWNAALKNRS